MATLLTDNFNSYADGSIVGKGNWTDGGNASECVVSSASAYEGAKGLYVNTASAYTNANNIQTGTTPTGQLTCYVYPQSNSESTCGVYLGNATAIDLWAVRWQKSGNFDFRATSTAVLATCTINNWYQVQIQWQTSDDTARARIDAGSWSSWYAPYEGSGDLDRVMIQGAPADKTFYIDYIAEDPYPTAGGPAGIATFVNVSSSTIGTFDDVSYSSIQTIDDIA